MKSLLVGLFSSASLAAAPPEGYYQSARDLLGNDLRVALHEIIDDHTVLRYGETRAAIGDLHQDPKNKNNLIQVYTRKSVPKMNDKAWNREHIWPRARGNTDKRGPDDTDLHHVFPSDYDVNADRAALLFDITSPPRMASRWSMDSDSFQPPAASVGDVARALFYMAVRYDGSDRFTANLTLASENYGGAEMGDLAVLIKWHQADPPDEFEHRRNDLIYEKYQGNRNPFIDFPQLVNAIWGNARTGEDFLPEAKDAKEKASCAKSSSSPSSPPSPVVPTKQPLPLPQPKSPKPRKQQ